MILQRYLGKILQESLASRIHARVLQERRYLASTENSCKFLERILQGNVWSTKQILLAREVNKSEVSYKNPPKSCISCTFCKILVIFCKNNAFSCKILQITSKNFASFVRQINQGSHYIARIKLFSFNSFCASFRGGTVFQYHQTQ